MKELSSKYVSGRTIPDGKRCFVNSERQVFMTPNQIKELGDNAINPLRPAIVVSDRAYPLYHLPHQRGLSDSEHEDRYGGADAQLG